MPQQKITDDLELMINVLPPNIAEAVRQANRGDQLLEIVLDLGRLPEARYTDGETTLYDSEVTTAEIEYVVSRISAFDSDNRAGIERTLHRISAIRNRRGNIVGLTCRVGRAVYGTIDIIEDIITSGQSILLLGKPGVGKTTMLREAARVLADKKRVVIVDTSNEIGGDGDIPHPAVGRARRMQVPQPNLQHEVMIEAVENHMPEVIVIDEIGRELEALAARTIAERGVQLIGTAHGRTLDNLLINPTLSDLVGGIESVTLSDEEARRRGTQKTVLERRAPPTFDVLIEIQDRQQLLVHHDVAMSVDNLVRGRAPDTELRYRDGAGNVHKTAPEAAAPRPVEGEQPAPAFQVTPPKRGTLKPVRVYAYGIAHNRLEQAAARLKLPVTITEDVGEADIVMTVKNYYRRRPKLISDAERRNTPIYVLRANTLAQMENCLADIFDLTPEETDPYSLAMQETQHAIQHVLSGARSVDLSPQNAFIRRQQHEMVRESNLVSHSYGKEPARRVRVYRE
jgi:stage III sporulation protein SpoIIIAA